MFLDEIHYAEELWASSTDTLNCMLRHRLSAEDFVFAKIWLNRKEIEKAVSTNVVRLPFI